MTYQRLLPTAGDTISNAMEKDQTILPIGSVAGRARMPSLTLGPVEAFHWGAAG